MKTRLLYPGTNSMVQFLLGKGESVKAESGAMVGMSSTVDVEGRMDGGILSGLSRAFLTGESFFCQTLKANRGDGNVLLAPASPGDIFIIDMDGMTEYNIQKGGFLASEESVQVDSTIQNLAQGLFSGEGFFILRARGTGKLVVSSFGAIHEINLVQGEECIIDNNHLVAWPHTTHYTIEKASSKGWISSFTSGEGLVCRFRGPGKVYIQTRNLPSFGSWLRKLVNIQPRSASSSSHRSNRSNINNAIDILSDFT